MALQKIAGTLMRACSWVIPCVLAIAGAGGCSVGEGEGSARGVVTAPACGLEASEYDLEPSFFVAQAVDGMLEIRIQRGSDLEGFSDGLIILVTDTEEVRQNRLRDFIALGEEEELVSMHFYLNETCLPERNDLPVNYVASSGTIRFGSIYAPDLAEDEVRIRATFNEVLFVDPKSTSERWARLSGEFDFLYNRGRPAQRFP